MSVTFDQAIMRGTLASRPAASAGTAGRFYCASDNGIVYRDNGSSWDEVSNDLQLGSTATTAAAGNDSRLSDARTPTAHATSHQSGGSDAFTGIMPGSAFAPAGLTGATAASRYVGATASGAPASGTFAVGDFVIDRTGTLWVCTTAGSPGTWTQVTGGGGGGGLLVGLGDQTLAATAATVTFSSIPSGYRDLWLDWEAQHSTSGTGLIAVQFNGDTAANYDGGEVTAWSGGTTATANTTGATSLRIGWLGGSGAGSRFGAGRIEIPDYTETSHHQQVWGRLNRSDSSTTTDLYTGLAGGFWRGTAAVTSITLVTSTSFAAGSRFTLYGLKVS